MKRQNQHCGRIARSSFGREFFLGTNQQKILKDNSKIFQGLQHRRFRSSRIRFHCLSPSVPPGSAKRHQCWGELWPGGVGALARFLSIGKATRLVKWTRIKWHLNLIMSYQTACDLAGIQRKTGEKSRFRVRLCTSKVGRLCTSDGWSSVHVFVV